MPDQSEHRFPRSESAHGCCGRCLACPTCDPEVVSAPCTGNDAWMRTSPKYGESDA